MTGCRSLRGTAERLQEELVQNERSTRFWIIRHSAGARRRDAACVLRQHAPFVARLARLPLFAPRRHFLCADIEGQRPAPRVDRDHRALLKLDLQGHELDALKGGTKLLGSIEVVMTEVSFYVQSRIPTAAEIIAFMSSLGFVLYDIASLSGRRRDNRLREGDLVFVRQDSQLLGDCRWE